MPLTVCGSFFVICICRCHTAMSFFAALWSPGVKRLISLLSCMWCFLVFLSLSHMVSWVRCGTLFINSWSLPPSLPYFIPFIYLFVYYHTISFCVCPLHSLWTLSPSSIPMLTPLFSLAWLIVSHPFSYRFTVLPSLRDFSQNTQFWLYIIIFLVTFDYWWMFQFYIWLHRSFKFSWIMSPRTVSN